MADIQEILKRYDAVRKNVPDPQQKQFETIKSDLLAFAQEQQDERNRLLGENSQHLADIAQLQQTNTTLQRTVNEQARVIDELKGSPGPETPPTSDTPANIVRSFKSVMDAIQAEAQKTPGVATTIKGMDLEIKGLVQIEQPKGGPSQTQLVLPGVGRVIQPEALSTLRVSFGAIPVVAPAAVAQGPAPTPPAPPPATVPAPAPTPPASPPAMAPAPAPAERPSKPSPRLKQTTRRVIRKNK